MKLTVNKKETSTSSNTLTELVAELALPTSGIAIAVNQQIIPKDQWPTFSLQDGQDIIIIKAVCGG